MRGIRGAAIALASGGVMALAFPRPGIWIAAVVSFALLWWSLERASVARAAFYGMLHGLGFFLPHLWWANAAVGPVPWVALALLESLAVLLFAIAWVAMNRRGAVGRLWLEPVFFALLWVAAEQLRSLVPFGGFPWGRVAFAAVDSPLAALAWFGGAPLLSFGLALVGGCAGFAFEALRARRAGMPLAALAAGGALLLLPGLLPVGPGEPSGTLRVGVVQGNVPNRGLDAFATAREVTENHAAGTEALARELPWTPDLLIWPENAVDIDPRVDAPSRDAVTAAASLVGAPLLLGTVDYSPPEGRYNTSLLWTPEGGSIAEYSKRRPAPFAEYIPIRGFARLFSPAVDRVTDDMIAGEEVGAMALPSDRLGRDVTLGVVICFEVAYDSIVREAVGEGGEILIVQTNNASFGATDESRQQLAMTRLRAIETGRTTVQASTVGVSAIVAPDGSVIAETGLFTAEYLYAEVPLHDSVTPAVRWGAWWGLGTLLAPLLLLLARWILGMRGRWDWE